MIIQTNLPFNQLERGSTPIIIIHVFSRHNYIMIIVSASLVFFLCLQGSNWPVFFHLLCIVIACLAISRGVSTIEPVNRIIVPTLLVIVAFSFYWSLYLPYAGMGIIHMFSPNWSKPCIQ